MIHLGDITQISGYEAPVVDVITGGSPCQDLSVAGLRKGLRHGDLGDDETTRSGLFMEQIRIIKEMRERERAAGRTGLSVRPRFAIWENVPGAFSSNQGEDFRAVIEEFCKIAYKDAAIPRPENGRWTPAGCVMGDGWSVAWRLFDAQFWGVPQRRKRIALVADFAGGCAPEILFERESLHGNPAAGGNKGQAAAGDPADGTSGAVQKSEPVVFHEVQITSKQNGSNPKPGDPCCTLNTDSRTLLLSSYTTQNSRFVYDGERRHNYEPVGDKCPTVLSKFGTGGGNTPIVAETQCKTVCIEGNGSRPSHFGDGFKESDQMYTLNTTEVHGVAYESHPQDSRITECGEVSPTVTTRYAKGTADTPLVVYENHSQDSRYKELPDICETVSAKYGTGGNNMPIVVSEWIVRRLTPLECERLQGFPDGWTDIGDWVDSKGKKHKGDSDSPRYKALGNSIALPQWKWILKRISAQYERDATLASLFDGIGGFPLIWEQINGKGSAVWASEIEEFPIAVTKYHFG